MSLLIRRDGPVMIITLNRPERLNALVDPDSFQALSAAWVDAAQPDVRAVILTGAGRGFCSGIDIGGAAPAPGAPGGLRLSYNPVVLAMAALPKPIIAAVNGAAAGAGLSLACAADIRIASTTAKFVPAFAKVGVVPDAGATWWIPRLVGPARAADWLTSDRSLDAATALDWGLVSEVVEPEDLLARALERAQYLSTLPPTALGLTKGLLARSTTSTLADQLEAETLAQDRAVAAPERAAARAAVASTIGARDRHV